MIVPSHAGLPPATIINAHTDLLLNDGGKYANKLAAAGVPVIHKVDEGVTHEFFGLRGLADGSDRSGRACLQAPAEVFSQ